MSRFRLRHAVALAVALLGLAVPVAVAAFVATISNTGSSFQAAAIFPGAIKMASGTYTGDATDNRAIAVGFQPDFVIVKDTGNGEGAARTLDHDGRRLEADGLGDRLCRRPTSSRSRRPGSSIGTDNDVNRNGRTYHWVAFKANSQAMRVGTYTGNGTSQSPTGFGFSPEAVILMGNTNARAVTRMSGMTRSFGFDNTTGVTTAVTSLDADGFSVGNGAEANTNGVAYHYVAFNDFANSIDVASYTGNNTDGTQHLPPSASSPPSCSSARTTPRPDDAPTGAPPRWPATARSCSPARPRATTASRRCRRTASSSARRPT